MKTHDLRTAPGKAGSSSAHGGCTLPLTCTYVEWCELPSATTLLLSGQDRRCEKKGQEKNLGTSFLPEGQRQYRT